MDVEWGEAGRNRGGCRQSRSCTLNQPNQATPLCAPFAGHDIRIMIKESAMNYQRECNDDLRPCLGHLRMGFSRKRLTELEAELRAKREGVGAATQEQSAQPGAARERLAELVESEQESVAKSGPQQDGGEKLALAREAAAAAHGANAELQVSINQLAGVLQSCRSASTSWQVFWSRHRTATGRRRSSNNNSWQIACWSNSRYCKQRPQPQQWPDPV